MTKKVLSSLLVVCLLLGVSLPARAVDLEDGQVPAPVVGTLEELRTAIDEAEVGDTIAVNQSITLDTGVLETDKQITLTRSTGFSEALLTISNGCQIAGFDFGETAEGSETVRVDFTGEIVVIRNCTFHGDLSHTSPFLLVYGAWMATNSLSVENCSFFANGYSAVEARGQTAITFTQCDFSDNSCPSSQGGAVYSAGVLLMSECVFSNNMATAGGGIYCSGELTVSDCQFSDNAVSNANWGKDIFCIGTLSVTDEMDEAAGYYEMTTGEKIELPLEKSTTFTKLAYFLTEEAEEYFRPAESEPEIEPSPMPDTDPDSGENDNPPQEPQEPPEDDDDDGEDYTPPKVEKPVQAPSTPARMLKCGDAVIDTSRSVVLAGYGDGVLHEDDPLTRAQLATIIYRVLSDETINKFQTFDSPFADVDGEAWCACYIATLARAGIVNGIGRGEYNPDGLVSWAQVLAVLTRFVKLQEYELQQIQYDGWAEKAVETAVALEWIEDDAGFNPDANISRGELVELLNRILKAY